VPEGWVLAAAGAGLVWAGLWILTLARFHALGKAFPELTPESPKATSSESIALVVAGRDEEDHLEACVRSLLAQDYPALELVFVDDRSSDGSREILARLEQELAPKLRALHVDELPPGWGGQTHGLHRGVAASQSEWICFTDADCRFESEQTLSIAMADAQTHGAEFLSVIPRLEAPTVWERTYLPLCSFVLVTGLEIGQVNDPQHPAGYANGAFILIRRAAYERLGGHDAVRQLVNDDVGLARRAKRLGVSLRVAGNKRLLQTRMYESLGGAWRGWSRNLYGVLRHVPRLSRALLSALSLFVLPWLALIASLVACALDPAWIPALATWGLTVVIAQAGLWRLYEASEITPAYSLLSLPGALFVSALLANSLGRSVRRTGTTWHGVHYPHPPSDP
jgi:chlorobactene glucosyltransferase